MNEWNRTAKVKAIVLGLASLPNLIFPVNSNPSFVTGSTVIVFLFTALIYPIIFKFNLPSLFGRDFTKPSWNDNPLTFKRPLAFIQFTGAFFVAVGLSMLIGAAIQFGYLPQIGLIVTAFGAGMFVSIFLTLRWVKTEVKN
jgi:hypothetical protein